LNNSYLGLKIILRPCLPNSGCLPIFAPHFKKQLFNP